MSCSAPRPALLGCMCSLADGALLLPERLSVIVDNCTHFAVQDISALCNIAAMPTFQIFKVSTALADRWDGCLSAPILFSALAARSYCILCCAFDARLSLLMADEWWLMSVFVCTCLYTHTHSSATSHQPPAIRRLTRDMYDRGQKKIVCTCLCV